MPAGGWRLAIHDVLASTQDSVLAAAAAGEPEGLAILARRQSAGRGTQGRAWLSPAGNLSLSLLLRPAGPARDLPQWSLLAGVALAEAADAILPAPPHTRLKWPNDLLLGGAKCAGILTQASLTPAGTIDWLVCGIGANLAVAPVLPDRPTASFAQVSATDLDPVAFARRLLAGIDRWRARGLPAVRAAWLARGPALRAPLQVRQGEGLCEGHFAGLDAEGRLLLSTAGGMVALAQGEMAG